MILALTSQTLTAGQLYDAADTILSQKLSQVRGIGQVTVGGSSLPAVRVELNPSALVQIRHRARGRARGARRRQRQHPQGLDRRRRAALPDLHQRPGEQGGASTSNLVIAYRNGAAGAPVGRRRGPGLGRERAQPRPLQRQAGGARHPLPPAGRQHHRHRRPREGADPGAQGLDPDRHRHHGRQRPHDHHPRLAARRRAHAADRRSRW